MMSDFLPKASAVKVGGLSRKAQKLQALRDKAEKSAGTKAEHASAVTPVKAKSSFAGKKPSFQRKAV